MTPIDTAGWLEVNRGTAPLVITFPHTGTEIPADLERDFTSIWHARRDTDWWIDELYAFARDMGVTTVRTRVSRSVIDVNRDPSGASLYPGQATTELCPTTDFDGALLYVRELPSEDEIARRRATWFAPYHAAIEVELSRLRQMHERVVLYDAHSIRSYIPRLFDGELPQFCIGTNGGTTCASDLSAAIEAICAASGMSHVLDGRFRGGWTTRHYGRPHDGIHTVQMELAQRGYMTEPPTLAPENWPSPIDGSPTIIPTLRQVIDTCHAFARGNL